MEILESLEVFPSTLPTRRESAYAGWVSISVGCNNTCTFCIVPSLRGKEKDRRPGDVLAEVQALVDEGVLEVTLLGQNVNSYGVEFGDRGAFGKLLRACGDIDGPGAGPVHQPAPEGLHRRRDRRDGRDAERLPLAAHAAAVRLRRRAAGDAPLLPAGALPGDHRPGPGGDARRGDHHRHHRRLPRRDRGGLRSRPWTSSGEARFATAFTFQYSKRPGTPAATMDGQVPKEVVQERYQRLIALQDEITWAENKRAGRPDRRGAGRRGRGPQGRAHRPAVRPGPRRPAGALRDRAAGPRRPARRHRRHRRHLRRAAPPGRRRRRCCSHRRTRAGDAREAGTRPTTPGVLLGMPRIGAPPA